MPTNIPVRLDALENPGGLLREIFTHAPVGLQIYARDGHCVLVNPMHTQLFGAVPPPEYNIFEDTLLIERGVAGLVQRAFAGERIRIPPIWYDVRELRNVRIEEGGRRLAVAAEMVPLRDEQTGEVGHVLLVFHDVTETHLAREAAESAARHAEFLAEAGRVLSSSLDYEATLARLARLATSAVADFCFVDVIDASGAIRRVASSHSDPAMQPILDEVTRHYPPDLTSPQPATLAIKARGPILYAEVDQAVIERHTRDARHRELMKQLGVRSHVAVPLLLGDRILGAINLGYVDTRRYSQADVPLVEALASRAAVAIENARLYRDAELARAEAEAANRAKDEFLAVLGHELRNPLAPIVTALQIARRRDAPSREFEVIERQVAHLRRLVDDLLDVARITRGKLDLQLAQTDLRAAVAEAVELARPLADAKRQRLEAVQPESAVHVLGDPVRLAQVVANLLTNATRYCGEGQPISVTTAVEGGEAIVRVADRGIGIAPDLLPHVFELFAQGKQQADRSAGGLGLGLAIVKTLVDRHGGRVVARSEGPGMGSEFEVRLPLSAGLQQAAPPAQPSEQGAKPCRILVVDDNVDAATTLAELLRSFGHEVHVAHEPHAALGLARKAPPDFALVDIGLPGMTGHELARRMRGDPLLASTKLVAVTGYGQAADRSRSREAGFDEHLVKPADIDQLQRLLCG